MTFDMRLIGIFFDIWKISVSKNDFQMKDDGKTRKKWKNKELVESTSVSVRAPSASLIASVNKTQTSMKLITRKLSLRIFSGPPKKAGESLCLINCE